MSIYKKLLEFQKQNIAVVKDGSNPHFKSKYPTLNEVLDKVKKPLNDLGIVIIQAPAHTGLSTILVDTETGEKVESFMSYVGADNAQKLLACNTYFRRGSLVALLGLEDEDDDGNTASAPKTPTKTATATATATAMVDVFEATKTAIEATNGLIELDNLMAKAMGSKKLTDEQKDELRFLADEHATTFNK